MNRLQLLDVLEKIKPGISNKDDLEGTNLVTFSNDRISSFNNEIMISHPFSFDIKGSIPATELYKLLQKINDDEITISHKDNQFLIKGKNKNAGINMVDKSFPNIKIPRKWIELPEDFIEALGFCIFSASTDSMKEDLTCISIQEDITLSCDNFRATRYKMKSSLPESIDLLIPLKAAKELVNYNPKRVSTDGSWIHFLEELEPETGTLFSCLTMDRKYLKDIDPFFDVKGESLLLPDNLKDILSRVEILAEMDSLSRYKIIHLKLEKNELVCRSQGEKGWIEETEKIDYDGEKLEIQINPSQICQILDKSRDIVIGKNSVVFHGENFSHVIALMGRDG